MVSKEDFRDKNSVWHIGIFWYSEHIEDNWRYIAAKDRKRRSVLITACVIYLVSKKLKISVRIELFWIPWFGYFELQWGSKELFIIYLYSAVVLLCHCAGLGAQSQLDKRALRGHLAVVVNELVTLLHLWDCISACGSDVLPHWFQSSQVFHFWLLIRHLLLIFWANTPSPSPENRIQHVCGGHCRGLKALLLDVKEQ